MRVGPLVPEETIQGMRGSPMWAAMEGLAHTLPYDGRVMDDTMFGRPLPAERWASVTVPTLVMAGSESPTWQRNGARALAETLPNTKYLTLEGQTHGFHADAMAPVLEAFFLDRPAV